MAETLGQPSQACSFLGSAKATEWIVGGHAARKRTGREDIVDLCHHGSLVEYEALAVISQLDRLSGDSLRAIVRPQLYRLLSIAHRAALPIVFYRQTRRRQAGRQ
jgi:hypothetical protein